MTFIRKIAQLKNHFTKNSYKIRLHKCTSNEKNFPTTQELIFICSETKK